MPDQLTDLERRVLDYLVEYLRTNTYQPSIREIGREFEIKSTKTVSELLQSLADKGWIERDPSRSRGVRLLGVEMSVQTVSLPVYDSADGTAAASHFELDRKIVAAHGAFLMPMTGDHLREEGVRPGDLLIVEPVDPQTLETGDLVVARSGGSNTARRCMRNGTDISLEPLRHGEIALSLTTRQATGVIRGRVTGLVRRLHVSQQDGRPAVVPVPVG
ncbi:MAG TPA: S24 family peptidase [Longimicrobiales bacterium]